MNLAELAAAISGEYIGDPKLKLEGLTELKSARTGDVSFVLEDAYIKEAKSSRASALVVFKQLEGVPNQIVVTNPRKAMAQTILAFYPNSTCHDEEPVVGRECKIADSAVLERGVQVGDRVYIGPNVTICAGTKIGNNVRISAGAVIGSCGFGYYMDGGKWGLIPHVGRVVLEDNVEIGANSCIDRGCLGETRIKEGTKIDNLVHIAHNTIIGEHCAIAAQVGCTGSAKIGKYVRVGGQAGIDGAEVGDGAVIAGKSGVTKKVASNETVSGFPAWDHRKELKKEAIIRKISQGKGG